MRATPRNTECEWWIDEDGPHLIITDQFKPGSVCAKILCELHGEQLTALLEDGTIKINDLHASALEWARREGIVE